MPRHPSFDDYLAQRLRDDSAAQVFLDVALLDFEESRDLAPFLFSLRTLVEARGGIAAVAAAAGLEPASAERLLDGTDASFVGVVALVHGAGLRLVSRGLCETT